MFSINRNPCRSFPNVKVQRYYYFRNNFHEEKRNCQLKKRDCQLKTNVSMKKILFPSWENELNTKIIIMRFCIYSVWEIL